MKSVLTAALLACMCQSANAATVGYDLINRQSSDGWSNFTMVFNDLVLSEGRITSWSAYGAVTGNASLVVLSSLTPSSYNVEGVFNTSLVANTVTTETLSFDVEDGWVLGLYQNTGKVDFSFDTSQQNLRFTNNNAGQPVAGSVLGTPQTLGTGRNYSFSAVVEPAPIPLPAPLLLLLSAIGVLGMQRLLTKRKDTVAPAA